MNYDDTPGTSRSYRGRHPGSNGRAAPSAYVKSQSSHFQQQLEQLEADAYLAVLRAFGAQSEAITWAKERLMSDLRKELNIDDVLHRQLLDKVHSDETVSQICRWRNSGGGSFQPPSPPKLEPLPVPAIPLGRKKQKLDPHVPNPMASHAISQHPPEVVEPKVAPVAKLPPPKKGPGGKKGKKGKAKQAKGKAAAAKTEPVIQEVHPWIGKRIKIKWSEDDGSSEFFESVICDYKEETNEFGLVYEMGTESESWEWVDLSKIPKEDIVWLPGPPLPLIARSQGQNAGGHGFVQAKAEATLPPSLPQPTADASVMDEEAMDWDLQTEIGALDEEHLLVAEDLPDILTPLSQVVDIGEITEVKNLQRLGDAREFVSARRNSLKRLLEELDEPMSDSEDQAEDDQGREEEEEEEEDEEERSEEEGADMDVVVEDRRGEVAEDAKAEEGGPMDEEEEGEEDGEEDEEEEGSED